MNEKQKYIPDLLQEIVDELKKLNKTMGEKKPKDKNNKEKIELR